MMCSVIKYERCVINRHFSGSIILLMVLVIVLTTLSQKLTSTRCVCPVLLPYLAHTVRWSRGSAGAHGRG